MHNLKSRNAHATFIEMATSSSAAAAAALGLRQVPDRQRPLVVGK